MYFLILFLAYLFAKIYRDKNTNTDNKMLKVKMKLRWIFQKFNLIFKSAKSCQVPALCQALSKVVNKESLTLGTVYREYAPFIMSPGWHQLIVQESHNCLIDRLKFFLRVLTKGNQMMQWMVRSSSLNSPYLHLGTFLLPELLYTFPGFCTFTQCFLMSGFPLGTLPWFPPQGLVPVLKRFQSP